MAVFSKLIFTTQLVQVESHTGQQNMMSLKAVWRNNKDGFIFTFAINNQDSFEAIISEIRQLKEKSLYSNVAMILVGNKIDLEHERKISPRQANAEATALGIKYFQISAKTSSKDEIDALIYELIQINQIERFNVQTPNKNGFTHWLKCDSSPCSLM